MTTAKEKAAQAKADKAAEKKAKAAAKKAEGDQIKVDLTAPKEDPNRAPREDDIGRRERGSRNNRSLNDQDEGEDTVYGVASRARWGGVDADVAQLSKDAKESEKSASEQTKE